MQQKERLIMINTREIKAQMQRKGMTQQHLAQAMGINPTTLNRKINNEEGNLLTVDEANKIKKVLEIPESMLQIIFFADSVADKQQKEGEER
jgi:transcriptional regulator with XRE-family HTH domain